MRLSKGSALVQGLALVVAGALLSGLPLAAQTTTAGAISGVVQDAQGAVVPRAKVTLTNDAQGAASARQITTGGDGAFLFTPLLAGNYTLTVELTGFKKYVQSNITLDVNNKLGLPAISLEIGSVGDTVTVEASAVQLLSLIHI